MPYRLAAVVPIGRLHGQPGSARARETHRPGHFQMRNWLCQSWRGQTPYGWKIALDADNAVGQDRVVAAHSCISSRCVPPGAPLPECRRYASCRHRGSDPHSLRMVAPHCLARYPARSTGWPAVAAGSGNEPDIQIHAAKR
ncbi:hypothetical protein SPFL3101_02853 [Sporomusaceae bacterium FL31]|nr:hypothetical protein SPFL3101_02853 [Sporomusaceae bacterium FL31]